MTVRQQIAVAQHDALRCAFRSGREEHHGRIVGALASMTRPRRHRSKQRAKTREHPDLAAHVFEIQHGGLRRERSHHRLELGLLDELPRGDNQLDLRGLARRLRRGRTGREVQHRRHAAFGLEPEERDDRRARGRQQHADAFASDGAPGQHTAERKARRDQPAIGQRLELDVIGNRVTAAVLLARLEQRIEQRRLDLRGREHRLHHLVAQRTAQRGAARATGDAFGRRQTARWKNADANTREPSLPDLPGQSRERRELRALDAHHHQRRLGAFGNDGGTLVDLHQPAGRRDASLGKDDAGRARLDRANHRADRQRIGRIDGEGVDDGEERLRPPLLRDERVDREDRIAWQERAEQQAVEERRVIGGNHRVRHRRARVLEAFDLHAIQQTQNRRASRP